MYHWGLLKNLIQHWRCYPQYLTRMVKRHCNWHKWASAVFRQSTHTDHTGLPCVLPLPLPNLGLIRSLWIAKTDSTHWAAITVQQFLFIPCSLALACCKSWAHYFSLWAPTAAQGSKGTISYPGLRLPNPSHYEYLLSVISQSAKLWKHDLAGSTVFCEEALVLSRLGTRTRI